MTRGRRARGMPQDGAKALVRPVRALFVSQGAVGPVMGHASIEASMQRGLDGRHDLEARFVQLPRWGWFARILGHAVPGLSRVDLDMRDFRGHVIEAVRGRRAILHALAECPTDVLVVDSHVAALLVPDVMRRVPTVLSVDSPVWEWRQLAPGRPLNRLSSLQMRFSMALERRIFRLAASVMARSRWTADAIRRTAPEARVTVLHPGVDIDLFVPAVRRARERTKLLFVGGRFAEKGGHDLLEAVGDLLGESVDLDVVTPEHVPAGEGVTVHHLGPGHPGLIELYQQADLLCLPTYQDAMPMTILESFACGTPVVTTAVSAMPELFRQAGAGVVIPAGRVEDLRQAILSLAGDKPLREEMGSRGRAFVERTSDAVVQGRAVASLLHQVSGIEGARLDSHEARISPVLAVPATSPRAPGLEGSPGR